MIRYPSRLITQDAFTDMEMLQTDVMRFMAILGLCLTAIFALVQTFPRTPVQAAPALPETDSTAAHEALQSKLQQLQQALRSASGSLTRAEAETAALQTGLQQTRGRLQSVTASLAENKMKQARLLRQQRADARVVVQLREQLASLQVQNSHDLAALEKSRSQVRALSKPQAQKIVQPKPAIQQPPSPPQPAAAPRPETKAKAVEATSGFTLRFASPEALEALIDRGTIRFFILRKGKARLYRLQGGIPRLSAVPMPVSFHEMAADTVPDKFRSSTEPVPGDVIWAVALPSSLERRLSQLVRGQNSGVLEIQANGTIRLRGVQ